MTARAIFFRVVATDSIVASRLNKANASVASEDVLGEERRRSLRFQPITKLTKREPAMRPPTRDQPGAGSDTVIPTDEALRRPVASNTVTDTM